MPSSRASSQLRDWTQISNASGFFTTEPPGKPLFYDWWCIEIWELPSETIYLYILSFLSWIKWELREWLHWSLGLSHTVKAIHLTRIRLKQTIQKPSIQWLAFPRILWLENYCKSHLDNSWTETENHGVSPFGTTHYLNEYQTMGLKFTGQKVEEDQKLLACIGQESTQTAKGNWNVNRIRSIRQN